MSDPTTPSPALLEELSARIREALPGVLGVYFFGSRAEGQARPDSDLDLAVLVAGYADPLQLWYLSSELADRAGCEVDLVDLRAASTVFAYQILMRGRRLWGQDPEAGVWEAFACTEKLRFDESRAGLLADIRARGHVYDR